MSRINIKFGDFVNIQPKIDLTKGANYPFIEMADVEPFSKQVNSIRSRVWKSSGGAKFENGDTIFARITPCLEHGKIAKIENLIGGKGFGSTEFYVFRAKDRISDKDYIYYLARSSAIREPAIKSMIGSSGRQRAQKSVIENIQINVPDIETQKRIVGVLANYDDLIENNKRRIALLEESARQLYKEWFVRFRFPGHEHVKIVDGVPEGWEICIYGEVSDAVGGGTPSTKVPEYWDDGDITWFVPKDLTQNNSLILLDSGKKITKLGLQKSSAKMLPPNTIMMSSRASIGYFGLYEGDACTNQGFISIVPKRNNTQMYLLHNLMFRKSEIIGLAGGTTYKEINKTTFRSIDVLLPPNALLIEFQECVSDLLDQVRLLMKQNNNLTRARDLLLPKLMNGEIAV